MRVAFYITIFLSICPFLFGQNPINAWESKPIDEWTERDIKVILSDSSWSRVLHGKKSDQISTIGSFTHDVYATFTLESSLVVRLAAIRRLQLVEKYDAMSAKDKAAFNSRNKPKLECSLCDKYYIIGIGGDSTTLKNPVSVKRRMKSIYLSNEKGEKRFLEKYSPQTISGSIAMFYFPRNDEKGVPLLKIENTTLTFNFQYEESTDEPLIELIKRVEIKVKDIIREKRVVF